jgi:hypothetical protein
MAFGCDLQDDAAAVGGVLLAADQAGFFAALAEFDDAVMAKAQPFGYVGHGCFGVVWGSGYVEQELVLLGVETGFGGTALAELEELAEGVAELGQGLESFSVVRL